MINIIKHNSPNHSNEEFEDKNTPDTNRSVSISHDVFDFIGDWILKDFLEHEAG